MATKFHEVPVVRGLRPLLLFDELNIFQTQHHSVWPAAVVVKTLGTFDEDFQSAVFLLESRADIVSRIELFGAMFLTQNSNFGFVSRFEFFQ